MRRLRSRLPFTLSLLLNQNLSWFQTQSDSGGLLHQELSTGAFGLGGALVQDLLAPPRVAIRSYREDLRPSCLSGSNSLLPVFNMLQQSACLDQARGLGVSALSNTQPRNFYQRTFTRLRLLAAAIADPHQRTTVARKHTRPLNPGL